MPFDHFLEPANPELSRTNLGAEVTDEGGRLLAGFPDLTVLDLDRTQITDETLQALSGLGKLEWLHLRMTDVTDAGLKHLESHTGLLYLNLEGTQVTAGGVAALQEKLPDCRILHESTQLDGDDDDAPNE